MTMSAPGQKAWKIQDFPAHEGNINCLALGHKSGYVLVTGGEDKKVNLWAIGKSNCIMSLSGKSPVQCVRFDPTENHVAAGSIDGVLKVWDLEAVKLIRTLSGHDGPIRALDFHPYGDFLTSGSQDTFIKLWDIRKKGCIFTYKGHSMPINSVRFSPDGQWVSSAGQDGIIKLWDLRAGKMLHEFCEHKGSVNSLVFHPHEFLLASASVENTINFYDLEHFSLVSSTNKEAPPARCLHFSNNGECLYAGSTDALRAYLWEPARTLVNMLIPWGRVHDLATTSNARLVGASYFQTTVSLWMVDLNQVKKDITAAMEASPEKSPFSHGNSLRKSFTKQKPTPEAKKSLSVKTIEESERSETETEEDPLPFIPDVNDYRAAFNPSRTLNRSPPPTFLYDLESLPPRPLDATSLLEVKSSSRSVSPQHSGPTRQPATSTPFRVAELQATPRHIPSHLPSNDYHHVRSSDHHKTETIQTQTRTTSRRLSVHVRDDSDLEEFPVKLSSIHHSQSETSIPRAASTTSSHQTHLTARQRTSSQTGMNKASARDSKAERGGGVSSVRSRAENNRSSRQVNLRVDTSKSHSHTPTHSPPVVHPPTLPPPISLPPPTILPTHSPAEPYDVDLSDFLPTSYDSNTNQIITDENELLTRFIHDHTKIMAILESRVKNVKMIQAMWQGRDLKSALDTALSLRDLSASSDVLSIIVQKPNLWTLDVCVVALPIILDLLNSKYEEHNKVGCEVLRLILKNFTPIIRTNVLSGSGGMGVDISREERYNKCMKCYNSLVLIRAQVLKHQTAQGPMGQNYRELHNLLQAIDSS